MNERVPFKPRLYVAGDALNYAQAVVTLAPSRVHRIVGTLSQTKSALQPLGPESFAA
jgi:hypothetical protein